jgi:hypothetical protein
MDGEPLTVREDGTIETDLKLKMGQNVCGLMVQNGSGCAHIATILLNVSNMDEAGERIVVADPVPYLSVNLPPDGRTLRDPRLTISGATDPGNRVLVNDQSAVVESDGSFTASVEIPRGASTLRVQAIDPEGHVGEIEREVAVKRSQLFFLALVDGKVGMLQGSGHLRGAGMDESSEFFTDGRVAYYLKGVIAGKYLITSAFDTGQNEFEKMFNDLDDAENERLLTNLDPDKFYPVYGDGSTIVYDAESQGKFYLAVDSDELHLLVGNYPLQYTDTELAAYQRTLFGGQVLYQSVSRTKYGQPDTIIAVFASEVRQVHVRDQLRATGGSIYFLSHQDVIEGSEQVTLELRDKDTGLILSRVTQRQNIDYTIKYEEGRILFNRPVSSIMEDSRLVDQALLSGNPVFIQVDYETRVDAFEKTAAGSRVKKQIGDHVGIGGTYVKDELESGDYELSGVDTEVRFGKNTRIVAEYAESSGTDSLTFESDDGGLTYIERPAGFQEGSAWKLGADLDIGEWFGSPDRVQVGGYMKRLATGFRSSGNSFEEGTTKFGGNAKLKLTGKDTLLARFDREEFHGAGPSEIAETDIGTVQWTHEEGRWELTGEYQFRDSEDGSGASLDESSFAAGRLRYSPIDSLTLGLEHQQTVSGPTNDQTTLSTDYQLNKALSLTASGTTGTLGEALQGGAVLTVDKGKLYVTERLAEDRSGARSTSTVLGGESPIG